MTLIRSPVVFAELEITSTINEKILVFSNLECISSVLLICCLWGLLRKDKFMDMTFIVVWALIDTYEYVNIGCIKRQKNKKYLSYLQTFCTPLFSSAMGFISLVLK